MGASLFQPALLAGIVIGVLSALPIVSAGNCCCCMWVVAGGALAAWLLQQNSARPITIAEGMLAGLAAGVVGAVVAVPISLASQALLGGLGMERDLLNRILENAQSLPPEMREALERARESSLTAGGGVVRAVVLFVFSLAVNLVFATLGGVLGALFFRKGPEISNWGSPVEPPPPPPPVPPSTI
jgi:hypothetical protein